MSNDGNYGVGPAQRGFLQAPKRLKSTGIVPDLSAIINAAPQAPPVVVPPPPNVVTIPDVEVPNPFPAGTDGFSPPAGPGVQVIPDPGAVAPPPPGGYRPPDPMQGIPGELQPGFGGRHYEDTGHDYLSGIATAELQGEITTEQGEALRKQFQEGTPGIRRRGMDIRLEGEEAQAEYAQGVAEANIEHGKSLAELAGQAAEFEGDERVQQELRHRWYKEGSQLHRERIEAADERLEEHRITDKRDVGARVLDGVAAALGALGAGFAKMPNYALQSIEARIERDLKSQLEDREDLRSKAKSSRSDLGAYQQEYGQNEAAHEALRARYYREYAAKVQAVGAYTQNSKAQLALEQIGPQLERRAAEIENRGELIGATEWAQLQAAKMRGGGGKKKTNEDVVAGDFQWFDLPKGWEEAYVDDPDVSGFIHDSKARGELVAKLGPLNELDDLYQARQELIEIAGGPQMPWDQAGLALDTIDGKIFVAESVANGQGAVSDGELKIKKQNLGRPQDWGTSNAGAMRQTQVARGINKNAKKRAIGGVTIQPGVVDHRTDEKGRYRPKMGLVRDSAKKRDKALTGAKKRAGRPTGEKAPPPAPPIPIAPPEPSSKFGRGTLNAPKKIQK